LVVLLLMAIFAAGTEDECISERHSDTPCQRR